MSCAQVYVLDFPPRLNHDLAEQELLREEFRRVAARMDVKYYCTTEYFPMRQLNLWCRDSVHLSDDFGSPILAQLLWEVTCKELDPVVPAAPAPSRRSPPARRVLPTVVVRGEVRARRRSDPFAWTVAGGKHQARSARKESDQAARKEVCVGFLILVLIIFVCML